VSARLAIFARALRLRSASGARQKPAQPQRILIAHQLLLGDTLMLTPLLAKLRERYPAADIAMALPAACASLYQSSPYGVRALPFSLRDARSIDALFRETPFDLAIIPGDNRYTWLAQALDARWIAAFAGDTPAYKNWLADELIPFPDAPGAWGDLAAQLVGGAAPAPYARAQWPSPLCASFALPQQPYCVLHAGASSPRKLWPASYWRQIAATLAARGYRVAWSAGRGEEHLVAECDGGRGFASYAGKLDLAQLWRLIENAALLVAPDTGVAHLGKVTGTPTVALFGPGPTRLYGAGEFWKAIPFYPVVLDDLPARNQTTLFRRAPPWLAGDGGPHAPCAEARALYGSGTECVEAAIERILTRSIP
jgi:ADP-heptose:LPS heptosyltransferase